jgi:hypothetical protein
VGDISDPAKPASNQIFQWIEGKNWQKFLALAVSADAHRIRQRIHAVTLHWVYIPVYKECMEGRPGGPEHTGDDDDPLGFQVLA